MTTQLTTCAVPALRAEGVIGLIAPAGPAELDIDKAMQWMRARGYTLRVFPGVGERDGYLAGSDDVRLNDLHGAFADPSIDAIFACAAAMAPHACWTAWTSTCCGPIPSHLSATAISPPYTWRSTAMPVSSPSTGRCTTLTC